MCVTCSLVKVIKEKMKFWRMCEHRQLVLAELSHPTEPEDGPCLAAALSLPGPVFSCCFPRGCSDSQRNFIN